MSVGVLLVSHPGIAQAMLTTVDRIWPDNTVAHDYFEAAFDADHLTLTQMIKIKVKQLDHGDGVLILTDVAGATPTNITQSIPQNHIAVVSGLNLPMLMRIYNYSDKSLEELTVLAVEGAKKGIAQLINTEKGNQLA